MKHRNSPLARLLTLSLALVMLFGMMTVGVNAATIKNVRHYDTYACLGDSIAAGFGPYNREIKGFQRIDLAYHAYVADAVGANTFYPLGRVGFRSTELRYMIDDTYEGDDFLFRLYRMDQELRDQMRPVFAKALRDSDLITLNVGSNDVMNYAYIKAYFALQTEDSELEKQIQELLDQGGDLGEAMNKLFSAAKTAGKLPQVLATFVEALFQGYRNFIANWDPMIHKIYEMNPDVTLVVVGMFNPIKNEKLTDISLVNIGRAFDTVTHLINLHMQRGSRYADRYLFADVWNTEVFALPSISSGGLLSTDMMALVHPTEKGHQYMATQIISVLPEQGSEPTPAPTADPTAEPTEQPVKEFPFKDVKGGDWFYPDVYYVWDQGLMNGKNAQTFDPDGTTTRAEFATVLWRLAGSPAVTAEQKAACPFTDLAADWYKDAVVWAYDAKVVNGMSADTFAPNEKITREQMVTMLYRYDGEKTASGDLSRIADADAISDYAKPAVAWAVVSGIVNGYPDGTFQPKNNTTRAQMAAIIARFDRMGK